MTILIAVPLAWGGVWFLFKGLRRSAHLIVTMEKAAKIILYELVPNEDDSIKDKVNRAVVLGEENQRALENHLIDHHNAGRSYPEGTPDGF